MSDAIGDAPRLTEAREREIRGRLAAYPDSMRAKESRGFGVSVWFVEYGPADDLSECFDLFEDPPKAVCEAVAQAPADVRALLGEVERLRAFLSTLPVALRACADEAERFSVLVTPAGLRHLAEKVEKTLEGKSDA